MRVGVDGMVEEHKVFDISDLEQTLQIIISMAYKTVLMSLFSFLYKVYYCYFEMRNSKYLALLKRSDFSK